MLLLQQSPVDLEVEVDLDQVVLDLSESLEAPAWQALVASQRRSIKATWFLGNSYGCQEERARRQAQLVAVAVAEMVGLLPEVRAVPWGEAAAEEVAAVVVVAVVVGRSSSRPDPISEAR